MQRSLRFHWIRHPHTPTHISPPSLPSLIPPRPSQSSRSSNHVDPNLARALIAAERESGKRESHTASSLDNPCAAFFCAARCATLLRSPSYRPTADARAQPMASSELSLFILRSQVRCGGGGWWWWCLVDGVAQPAATISGDRPPCHPSLRKPHKKQHHKHHRRSPSTVPSSARAVRSLGREGVRGALSFGFVWAVVWAALRVFAWPLPRPPPCLSLSLSAPPHSPNSFAAKKNTQQQRRGPGGGAAGV